MVQLLLRLTAPPERAQHLVQALQALLRRDRLRAGCCGGYVAADLNDPAAFWFSEDWEDRPALERQLVSEQFTRLLELVESTASEPLLEFRVVDERLGLEYVADIRRADQTSSR